MRAKDSQGLKVSIIGQRRLRTDRADAKADLSLLGAHASLLVLSCAFSNHNQCTSSFSFAFRKMPYLNMKTKKEPCAYL